MLPPSPPLLHLGLVFIDVEGFVDLEDAFDDDRDLDEDEEQEQQRKEEEEEQQACLLRALPALRALQVRMRLLMLAARGMAWHSWQGQGRGGPHPPTHTAHIHTRTHARMRNHAHIHIPCSAPHTAKTSRPLICSCPACPFPPAAAGPPAEPAPAGCPAAFHPPRPDVRAAALPHELELDQAWFGGISQCLWSPDTTAWSRLTALRRLAVHNLYMRAASRTACPSRLSLLTALTQLSFEGLEISYQPGSLQVGASLVQWGWDGTAHGAVRLAHASRPRVSHSSPECRPCPRTVPEMLQPQHLGRFGLAPSPAASHPFTTHCNRILHCRA